MPLVPAKCTQCGATLEVDQIQDAAICSYCKTPFIIEKAINNYNTINIVGGNTDFDIQAGELKKYSGSSVDVVIPDTVVKIGSGAFKGMEMMRNITIPQGVTKIGEGAFSSCRNLTSIAIPNRVTIIYG